MGRIGERNKNNNDEWMTIIEYNNSRDITIEFDNGGIVYSARYSHFKTGQIKNPYTPSVCGVGYLGDATGYENGKPLKSYQTWVNMLKRCYDIKYQERFPTYKGCEVCDEWKCYADFKKWYDYNIYEINGERVCLDKDILIKRNKTYSPETCLLVPESINMLFTTQNKNNNLPKGVCWYKKFNKYGAYINIDGKKKTLGYFDNISEAKESYLKARNMELKRVAEKYKEFIPEKLYYKLIEYKEGI